MRSLWNLCSLVQVDAHSNLGNLMKAQGLVQEVGIWQLSIYSLSHIKMICLMQLNWGARVV